MNDVGSNLSLNARKRERQISQDLDLEKWVRSYTNTKANSNLKKYLKSHA